MTLTVGSLFSGLGGIDLACERAGWELCWQVENDAAANRVLVHHWPGVRRFGNVREVGGGELEPVDLIVGGWPCQDNSVAGKRAGMAGDRSGLFSEIVRIARALSPRWLLLENVPGLLSVGEGRDMGAVLRQLGELGFWWAYRSLDAQHFGLAQRRQRVFFVCDSRDPAGPAKVLFEPESCAGDTPPSRETGEGVAASLTSGSHGAGVNEPGRHHEDDVNLVAGSIRIGGDYADPYLTLDDKAFLAANPMSDRQMVVWQCQGTNVGEMGALRRGNGHVTGGVPFVAAHETGKGWWTEGLPGLRAQPGGMPENLIAHTLRAEGADASEDGTGRGVPIVAFDWQAGGSGDTSFRGKSRSYVVRKNGIAGSCQANKVDAVAISVMAAGCHGSNGAGVGREGDPAMTLDTTGAMAVGQGMAVRRLTPTECLRLQGLPETTNSVTIWVCGENQKKSALAAIQSLKSPSSASDAPWMAGDDRLQATASSVARNSAPRHPSISRPVAVNVRISCGEGYLEIRRLQDGLLLYAGTAEQNTEYQPPVSGLAFARLAVLMTSILGRITQDGKAGLPEKNGPSIVLRNGHTFVVLSGNEMAALVNDAASIINKVSDAFKSTTSEVGSNSPTLDLMLATLSSCVASAIVSCIPAAIPPDSSYSLSLQLNSTWLDLDPPLADSTKYRLVGNSVAVPVVEWIARRLRDVALVDDLAAMACPVHIARPAQ